MAKKSGSIFFPFDSDIYSQSLKRATTPRDVFNSSIKAFLLTRPLSRRMNTIGSKTYQLLHKLIPIEELPRYSDEIKNELSEQFPEIDFIEVKLSRDTEIQSNLRLTIRYTSVITDIEELVLTINQ